MDIESVSALPLRQRLIIGAAAVSVLIAGGIAVAIGGDDDPTVDVGLVIETTRPPTTSATTATIADPTTTSSPPPASVPSTTTETTTPPTTVATPLFDRTGLERQVVIELANGVVLVRYSEPTAEDCGGGDLVAEYDGDVVRVYDEIGFAGGIRAYPGPFDQAALVGNCEEETTWIMFADNLVSLGAPLAPIAPDLTPVHLPNRIGSLREFAWVGNTGYFGATATFYNQTSSWNDAVVMSPETTDFMLAIGTIGQVIEAPSVGVDLVVPNGWTIEVNDDTTVLIRSERSNAYVRVQRADVELPAPTEGAGGTFTGSRRITQEVWLTGDDGFPEFSHLVGVEELFFSSAGGERGFRTIIQDGTTWEIEHFSPAGEGPATDSLGAFAARMVRIFLSFG